MLVKPETIEKARSRYLKGSIEKLIIRNAQKRPRTYRYSWTPSHGYSDGRFKPKGFPTIIYASHDTGNIIVFITELDLKTQKVLSKKEKRYTNDNAEEAEKFFLSQILEWFELNQKYVSKKVIEHLNEVLMELSYDPINSERKNNEVSHLLKRF